MTKEIVVGIIGALVGAIVGGFVTWFFQLKLSKDQLRRELRLKTMREIIKLLDTLYFDIRDLYNYSNSCFVDIINLVEYGNPLNDAEFIRKYSVITDALQKLYRTISNINYIINSDMIMFKKIFSVWMESKLSTDYINRINELGDIMHEIRRLYRQGERESVQELHVRARGICHEELANVQDEFFKFVQKFKGEIQDFVLGDLF